MQTILSPQDCSRLMKLASTLAARHNVGSAEAVNLIEAALMQAEAAPRRRSIADFAAGMLAVRSRRNDAIGADIFRDPAWDMMLDLLAAAHQGRQVSVSSLCYASGVPNSTALRHIEHLDQLGLVERTPDPEDHRRAFIRATDTAIERMSALLARMQDAAVGIERTRPHPTEVQPVQGEPAAIQLDAAMLQAVIAGGRA
ncbi:DNA-binding MarR family transcriptional regulator [Sphingomonas zeicaulis]|uniref:winged helix DNA-binding protein n=1 Tax=Sphingomonas zeicaulis TaxID=1632740 RepID=UPI003D21B483